MLTLKKHTTFHLPNISRSHELTLSPVQSEDDELIWQIENEAAQRDDTWTLTQAPDTEELGNFWQGVEEDIAKDPEWVRFNDD